MSSDIVIDLLYVIVVAQLFTGTYSSPVHLALRTSNPPTHPPCNNPQGMPDQTQSQNPTNKQE